jgi:hypothetical protein
MGKTADWHSIVEGHDNTKLAVNSTASIVKLENMIG